MKRVKQALALLLTLALLLMMGGVAEETLEVAEVIEAAEEVEEEVIEAVEPEPAPAPEAPAEPEVEEPAPAPEVPAEPEAEEPAPAPEVPAEPEATEPAPALVVPVEEVVVQESEAAEPEEILGEEPVLMVDEFAMESQGFDASSDFVIEKGVLVEYTGRDANVVIPDGVTSIGEQAFAANDFVKDVRIPEGVTSIGDSAFWSCRGLFSISLPNGLESIGANAFEVCFSLESITIPGSVKSIGEQAFNECRSLHTIEIQEGVKKIPAGMCMMSGLTSLEIPGSVKKIGNAAFYYCEQMRSAIIPDSVTEIEANAFSNCEALETVQLSRNLTKLNDAAFANCTHLRTISMPEHLKEMGLFVFNDCSSLESIVIPDGVEKIDQETFSGCTSLRSAKIPESVTYIAARAFSGCSALANVEIPDGVTNIGSHAFSGCTALESIKLPKALKYLSGFDHCNGLREVVIPESVEVMDDTFNFCKNLETVTVQEHPDPSVHIIVTHNFENCPNLKDVYLPKRSNLYGKEFVNCPQLTVHLYEGSDAEAYCKENNIAYIYREDDLEPDLYVTCTPATAKLTQNETVTLKASTVSLSKKESYSYSVDKSGAAFVSVSSAGKVTAKKPGVAIVTVTGKTSKQKATCSVMVIPAPTKVTLSQTSASITTDDDSLTLTASVAPAEAAQDVKWKSSDVSVATVSDEGVVTPVGDGNATITATTVKKATDGKAKSAKFALTVIDHHKPNAIALDQEGTLLLNLDETLPLSYKMTAVEEDQDARSEVTWSIPKDQQKYATVDDSGVVHPNGNGKEGTVTVTVKTVKKGGAKNKQLTDAVKISIVDPLKPRSVQINGGEKSLQYDYHADKPLQLTSTIEPSTATPGVTWSIPKDQQKIATIDRDSGVLTGTGKKFGTVTVTVTTVAKKSNKKAATATIKVAVVDPTAPVSLQINGGEKSLQYDYYADKPLQLTSTVAPATATKDVTWSIPKAQQKIATIDKDSGELTGTGTKFGTVTVTATTVAKKANGKAATATIKVAVADPLVPQGVQIEGGDPESPLYYEAGKTLQLTGKVLPETATPGVTWSIPKAQQKIATIDKDSGELTPTGTKFGAVTVTATTVAKKANGKAATATLKITVADPTVPFSVKIDPATPVELKAGTEQIYTATIEPAGTTQKNAFTWSIPSKQQKYATVDKATGTLTALRAGKVTLTVKTANGKKDEVTIQIVP